MYVKIYIRGPLCETKSTKLRDKCTTHTYIHTYARTYQTESIIIIIIIIVLIFLLSFLPPSLPPFLLSNPPSNPSKNNTPSITPSAPPFGLVRRCCSRINSHQLTYSQFKPTYLPTLGTYLNSADSADILDVQHICTEFRRYQVGPSKHPIKCARSFTDQFLFI